MISIVIFFPFVFLINFGTSALNQSLFGSKSHESYLRKCGSTSFK